MLKKNKGNIFSSFNQMAIAKRITLLYGGIFTLSLLFLSFFMILNFSSVQQSTMRRELLHSVERVKTFLDSGNTLSDEALATLQEGSYVEITIHQYREDRIYHSKPGTPPPFLYRFGQDLGKMPVENEKKTESELHHLREKELRNQGFEISMHRESSNGDLEYILENERKQQFMLFSTHHQTEEGMYRIQASRMLADDEYMTLNFISKLVFADIIGIFCAFLIGRNISRKILKPVEAIREAAERISIEDLSQRIPTEGPEDEMKELTVTFNSMIERLETSFQKQNQFISDASHELRTPISVLQGYANLINRWGKSDPEVLQESIDSILTETEHMHTLVRQLLFLAKGDQNKLVLKKVRMSLNESAAELVREISMLHGDRLVTFAAEEEVEIFADEDLIKQLLWIHAENALKYSPKESKIEVRVRKDEMFGYVSVKDYGQGIAEEEQQKIFDRFYRTDKSRNKEISGTGLGLSIAKWIVESHSGKILVESKQGEGTMFVDQLPLWKENQICGKKK